jgi:hypothetical protein
VITEGWLSGGRPRLLHTRTGIAAACPTCTPRGWSMSLTPLGGQHRVVGAPDRTHAALLR